MLRPLISQSTSAVPTSFKDHLWQDTVSLICQLIQSHPVYASAGQTKAFNDVADFLNHHQCGEILVDDYDVSSIEDLPCYVDVENFCGIYSNYRNVPKRNVISICNGAHEGPTVILNGHVDVDIVSTPELWALKDGWRLGEVKDGKLIGRGACDMLSGLGCLMFCAAFLANHRERWGGRLILTAVCDEEIGGNGTLRALQFLKEMGHLDSAPIALIAEPSDGIVCSQSLGFLNFEITLSRPSIHMGVATREHSLFDDIHKLESEIRNQIVSISREIDSGIRLEEIRTNFGAIQGGIDPALPLGSISIHGTVFFPKRLSSFTIEDIVRRAVGEIVRQGTIFHVEFKGLRFEGSSSPNSPLLDLLVTSSAEVAPKIGSFPSPCDARVFDHYEIPVTIFGPGQLAQAHSVDEHISVSELRPYAEHVLTALKTLLRWS